MKKCELCGIEKQDQYSLCVECENRLEISKHYYSLNEEQKKKYNKDYILDEEEIIRFSAF